MKILLNSSYDKIIVDTSFSATIEDAFNGVKIITTDGKELNICLRDYGFDMRIDDGNDRGEWFHIDSEEDICCLSCQRKKKLEKLDE